MKSKRGAIKALSHIQQQARSQLGDILKEADDNAKEK